MSISPQGYQYNNDPKSTHPFWETDNGGGGGVGNITASASVNDATGLPSVTVTKTQDGETVNFDFNFVNLKGEQGDKGDTGEQGPQGETGPEGPQGPAGADGATGPAGPQGETGATGATGPKGDTGEQGPAGADGKNAVVSADAYIADDGGSPSVNVTTTDLGENEYMLEFTFNNIKGASGAAGTPGEKGETGPEGPQGPAGDTGAQGPQGEPGTTAYVEAEASVDDTVGTPSVTVSQQLDESTNTYHIDFDFSGLKGEQGIQGPQGETGPEGPAGPQGEKGDTGDQGPQGPPGESAGNDMIKFFRISSIRESSPSPTIKMYRFTDEAYYPSVLWNDSVFLGGSGRSIYINKSEIGNSSTADTIDVAATKISENATTEVYELHFSLNAENNAIINVATDVTLEGIVFTSVDGETYKPTYRQDETRCQVYPFNDATLIRTKSNNSWRIYFRPGKFGRAFYFVAGSPYNIRNAYMYTLTVLSGTCNVVDITPEV